MDYLASNLDWLQEKLEALQAGKLHGAAGMLPSQACRLSRQGTGAGRLPGTADSMLVTCAKLVRCCPLADGTAQTSR